jgi:hypothetical protein
MKNPAIAGFFCGVKVRKFPLSTPKNTTRMPALPFSTIFML